MRNVHEVIRELLHKRFSDVLRHVALLLEIENVAFQGVRNRGPASSGSGIGTMRDLRALSGYLRATAGRECLR
ncbi:MAG TPA: hypothetical protein PLR37_04085 [Candidatus Accumulibacter phosphatis]|nr:hypothetical protein [Candidatus Accumulibacter phosphatis]